MYHMFHGFTVGALNSQTLLSLIIASASETGDGLEGETAEMEPKSV